jgi:hypothetical protein
MAKIFVDTWRAMQSAQQAEAADIPINTMSSPWGRWLRTKGRPGVNLAKWGARGAGKSIYSGAMSSFGMYKGPTGRMQFMGGQSIGKAFAGWGVAAGVGALAYSMTGNQYVGAAAGWGAAKGAGKAAISMAAWEVGTTALTVAFKGTAIGAAGSAAMSLAMPLAAVAAVGYGLYKGAEYLSERGHQSTLSEFLGDNRAFQTDAAYTMRQRALQEISRSHTNARTVLGQEAQLMHL